MAQGAIGRRLVSACIGAFIAASMIAASDSILQAAARTPLGQPAIATAEDAKPFLGRWTTTFDSPQGAVTFDIEVHLDTGDPGATVSNSLIGDAEVTDVTKSGSALLLRYVAEVQGTQVPVAISLVPAGETLKADFSFMDGQYAASSVATRKK